MLENIDRVNSTGLVNDLYYKSFLPLLTLTMYELVGTDSFFCCKIVISIIANPNRGW